MFWCNIAFFFASLGRFVLVPCQLSHRDFSPTVESLTCFFSPSVRASIRASVRPEKSLLPEGGPGAPLLAKHCFVECKWSCHGRFAVGPSTDQAGLTASRACHAKWLARIFCVCASVLLSRCSYISDGLIMCKTALQSCVNTKTNFQMKQIFHLLQFVK